MVSLDLLSYSPVTGRRTSLPKHIRRALRALVKSEIPFAVIGATALAVRGLPRMTEDLDVVVVTEDAFDALDALESAGFSPADPVAREGDPEAMYRLRGEGGQGEVDLLVSAGEPESMVVAEAPKAQVFGVEVPVATLEHLLLMYLYSNQPKHLGDFARIVVETQVDLSFVERYLADVHPEMLSVLRDRVQSARNPPSAPPRPPARRPRR
jgi:hypothetical protein